MTSRLVLAGDAQNVQQAGQNVTFELTTGGVPFHVTCTRQQWQARGGEEETDLIVHGTCALHPGESGPYITVVVYNLLTSKKAAADARKSWAGNLEKAKADYRQAKADNVSQAGLERLARALVKAHDRYERMEREVWATAPIATKNR